MTRRTAKPPKMPPRIFAALSLGLLLVTRLEADGETGVEVIWVDADGAAGVEVLPLLSMDVASVERGVDDGDVELVALDGLALCVTLLSPAVLMSTPVGVAANETESVTEV